MKYRKPPSRYARELLRPAAVFVDYENLYDVLTDELEGDAYQEDAIIAIASALFKVLEQERECEVATCRAYADFGGLDSNGVDIQQSLFMHGCEPRFTPNVLHRNASELQLSIEATSFAFSRPEVDTIVVLSGSRLYAPLDHFFRSCGKHMILVSVDNPQSREGGHVGPSDWMDAIELFRQATDHGESMVPVGGGAPSITGKKVEREGINYQPVSVHAQIETLRIVEEFFGQYDEVYLTPLLRKLSELLGESGQDPKTIISDLTDAGAVWLEKRRGYPYDYTVLLVDDKHPTVAEIKSQFPEVRQEADLPEEHLDPDDILDNDHDDPVNSSAAGELVDM